jgi:hypothetical protein
MSVTSRMEFDKVDLGKMERKLRDGLYNDNYMADNFFPVSLVSTKLIIGVESRILYPPIGRFKFLNQSFYPLILPQIMVLYYASNSIKFNLNDIGLKGQNQMLKVSEEKSDNTRMLLIEHYKKIPNISKWIKAKNVN